MPSYRKSLSTEILPGVYAIRLPLPGKRPGPVNAYLFTGDPATLVDTGTAVTFRHLQKGLHRSGLQVKDLRQIVITHGHIDHYGAARRIKAESGADVITGRDDRNVVERNGDSNRDAFMGFLRMCSVPVRYRFGIRMLMRMFRRLARPCRVDRAVSEGDTISLGGHEARVIETPGHSRGSICLYLPGTGMVLSGDHILPHITPNAFVMLEARGELPRRKSQLEFYASIKKIEDLNPVKVLPAHGPVIDDLQRVTGMYRRSYRLRLKRTLAIVSEGHNTVYRIALRLFPVIDRRQMLLELYLMTSEVYSHLQVLEEQGKVQMALKQGRLRIQVL